MEYRHITEDLVAISTLLRAGKIDSMEAREMREYVESLV
jgi:hypothetical protein